MISAINSFPSIALAFFAFCDFKVGTSRVATSWIATSEPNLYFYGLIWLLLSYFFSSLCLSLNNEYAQLMLKFYSNFILSRSTLAVPSPSLLFTVDLNNVYSVQWTLGLQTQSCSGTPVQILKLSSPVRRSSQVN